MSSKRILVVEDEHIVAMDVRARLEALGYDVVGTVPSGEEAIEMVGSHRPDLVLMDIMLRGELDGIQAAEIIRDRFGCPVIYVTAYADAATLERAKITEPFAYILKPFEDRELHGHIEIALYKHRSEQKIRESEERYELASQGANDGLWDWDFRQQKIYFSPRWEAILGYEAGELGQHPREWFSRLHPGDGSRVKQEIAGHVRGESKHFESEYRILTKDGSYRWVLTRGVGLRDQAGKVYRMAGSQTDITDRKVYDPTTGLPGKALFVGRIQNGLDRSRQNQKNPMHCAVFYVELYDPGTSADSLAREDRDEFVSHALSCLQGRLCQGETLAHFGEGRFGILTEDLKVADDVNKLATNIQEDLTVPFFVNGEVRQLNPSIGIALSSTGYSEGEEMLRDANAAADRARTSGGESRIEVFDQSMRIRLAVHMQKEKDLRWGIENKQLEVHYQPIVSLSSGQIAGVEALARWRRGNELVSPEEFVPLAEQSSLITSLDKLVLLTALSEVREWEKTLKAGTPFSLSVNLSARCYAETNLAEEIKRILDKTGFDPKSLKLELTESALIENLDGVAETLTKLRDMDIAIAMDDFGTGYSSLSYLHRFPIGTLKIDRCFVRDLGVRNEARKIVQTIVALGRNLGMEVTAEGVESARQMIELQAFDCNYAQGFLFSRPLNKVDVLRLLNETPPWISADEGTRGEFLSPTLPENPGQLLKK